MSNLCLNQQFKSYLNVPQGFFFPLYLQNSIRHNLSLHDMFIRETSPDGKISFWTIRPEANRCLTLDQVFKVSTTDYFYTCDTNAILLEDKAF